MDQTIHVSGAGPAGLAAAITLARSGRRVVVYEQRRDVGGRFHGDFQGLENWTTDGDVLDELTALGIDVTFECAPYSETVVFDPEGRAHTCRSAQPLYYLVRRGPGHGTIDCALRSQAERCGVEIRFGEARRHLPEGGIVADGPHRADAIAVGYVFETDMADGAYGVVSDRLALKGYSYVLVRGGRGTLASTIFQDFHNEKTYLARTVDFFQGAIGLRMRNARRFGGLGNFSVPRSARRGRLLLAGEAAGFQDSLWGFGMRYAVVSGHLAAQAFIEGQPEAYDSLWASRFGGLLQTGAVNRYLYEKLGDRGYQAFLRRVDRAPDARAWLRKYYGGSMFKRALVPFAIRSAEARRRTSALCGMEGCDCTWCRCQHAAGAHAVTDRHDTSAA
jgi:flavin-dependent dehydrogenase